MNYQISSGNGPAECELGVAKMLEYLQKHHAIKVLSKTDGYYDGTYRSVLFSCEDDLTEYLMLTEFAQKSSNNQRMEDSLITITSPTENVIATCHKVVSSGKMGGGKSSPKYALFGASNGIDIFGGESRTFLGWYANEDEISREIKEIHNAIISGIATYTLKYSVKTKKRFAGMKIDIE